MVDVLTKEQRRRNMQAIRSVSKLESKVAKELWSRGIRFRRNMKDLLGKPDFSIKKYKVVIFIDSCFWHGCPLHGRIPATNSEYWAEKINKNKKRDRKVNNHYLDNEWNILRIWEHEVKKDFDRVIDMIIEFIYNAKIVSGKEYKRDKRDF